MSTATKSTKKTKAGDTEVTSKLRIQVKAYDARLLDNSVKLIIETAMKHDAIVHGPTPLPTNIKKYTVNRSAFIYKNSREQFESRTHRRLIDILNPSARVIEALTNMTLPSGISVEVKMM